MNLEKHIVSSFENALSMKYGAKFYKADLHFHTPASEDARGENRYDFNPYKIKYPQKKKIQTYRKAVNTIQENILKDARKLAADIVDRFLEVNLSLVAITDHNGIGTIWADDESDSKCMDLAAPTWYELIDDEANKINTKAGKTVLTILPGTEISTNGMHILAIFPPQNPRRKVHFIICDLLNEVGFAIDDWGRNPKVGTASVFNTINLVVKKGGVPIPAHIDGSDQAMLKLFKINSGAMKNVLQHKYLSAVEIVKPSKFTKKDKKLKRPLKHWIDSLRMEKNLSYLAYFQGSDAHDLQTIAKRHTYIKMTEPSFSGLQTAINMPSSRVRISKTNKPETNGFYVHSIKIENNFFGNQLLRFNRHLNCITSKKGAGKSLFFQLMQTAVNPSFSKEKGIITLFIEKVIDSKSHYYAFVRNEKQETVELYEIDQKTRSVSEIDIAQSEKMKIKPRFYNASKIEEYITSREKLNIFLVKYFGEPSKKNVSHFNELFSISRFLQEQKEQLLFVKAEQKRYRFFVNTQWLSGKEKMREFFTLSHSLRRTMMLCMIVMMDDFGPTIIDAPEASLDNDDIVNYLVPIIKAYKDSQQVILFTNNPILAVNTDPDNYIMLGAQRGKKKTFTSGFAIDDENQKPRLLNIVEGSLKSFHKRAQRYESNQFNY